MEGHKDGYRIHRSTSIRLRKRRDQAKKEFLKDRRSGEFGYNTRPDGWSYVSFQSPLNVAQPQTSGPVSLCVNPVRDHPNTMAGGARSLCFIPSIDSADKPHTYYPPGPMTVSDNTARQVMSDTEDCVRTRRRGGRGDEEARERKLWRRSAIGLGEGERARRIVYKDFGMIDKPQKLESLSEKNISSRNRVRVQRNQPVVTSESRADWRQENCGQVFKGSMNEPFSLPVTVKEQERQNEQFPLLKGMLWQKKERMFSRWKERFFILTPKYLQCYAKSPIHSSDRVLFKVQLSSIEKMDLTEKKGYLTIALAVHKEGKILLRSSLGIREWFLVIKRCCASTIEQKSTEEFWSGRLQRESDNTERWLLGRQGLGTRPVHHTSTPAIRNVGVCPSSLYNQSVPTIYHTDADQTLSQHNIWSHQDTSQQIYAKPLRRNNTQKYKPRPKSCVETSNPWYLQSNESQSSTKHGITKYTSDPISEDSGNSSLSTSIQSSRRREKKSKSFLQKHSVFN